MVGEIPFSPDCVGADENILNFQNKICMVPFKEKFPAVKMSFMIFIIHKTQHAES